MAEIPRRRVYLVLLVFVVFMGSISVRLVLFQVLRGAALEQTALDERFGDRVVPARRGTITDRNGHSNVAIYDAINRRLSSTNALGHTTQYLYDPVGNNTRITDGNGHATQYEYDAINRVIRETYADAPPNTHTHR